VLSEGQVVTGGVRNQKPAFGENSWPLISDSRPRCHSRETIFASSIISSASKLNKSSDANQSAETIHHQHAPRI
jgi:hypothetical protein